MAKLLEDLSLEYFWRLRDSNNPKKEFDKILSEINNIVYEYSNLPITSIDKLKLINIIIEELENYFEKSSKYIQLETIQKAFSNDNYLELIDYIKSQIKK